LENNTKPIFVTGGTGLLGSHLIYALISKGDKVRAIHRKTSNRDILRKVIGYYGGDYEKLMEFVEWTECDINDYERLSKAMKGVDFVYHCAAAVSFKNLGRETIIDNNVTGTSNIVKGSLENRIKKLCHVSSNAALGAKDGEFMVDETHEWNEEQHHSPYAISKYLSEQEVLQGIRKGLNAVIVNPTIILGPGEWSRGSASFFSRIDKGMLFCTSGTTGYVDVNDVVNSMIALMMSGISGERFIINSDNPTYEEFFTMVASSVKARKPVIKVPRIFSYLVMPAVQLLEIVTRGKSALTKEMIKVAWSKITYDNSKVIKYTGISFKPIEKSVQEIGRIYLDERKGVPR
jgi:nucleoside-diphosphate-sugar epimerase